MTQLIAKSGDKIKFRHETKEDLEKIWELYSTLRQESRLLLPSFNRKLVERWSENIDKYRFPPVLAVQDNRVIGRAVFTYEDSLPVKHRTEFGIVIHDDFQDQGIGTGLTKYMIKIAEKAQLEKITLEVFRENLRAIHVYEKCGFHQEGLLEQHYFFHNRYYDVVLMGLKLK